MSPSRPASLPALSLAASLLAAAALPCAAAAQNKADAFAGKIPPVSAQLYQKAGRLEVVAGGDLSLNDAFFTKYFGSLELGYHFNEAWAVSLRAAGGAAVSSGSTAVCTSSAGCGNPTETMLRQVPGRIRGLAAAGVAWSPVYGKLNVIAEKVAHFDLALIGGGDLVAHDDVLSKTDAEQGVKPKLTTSPGFHVGLGAHLFLTEFMAVRVQVQDLVYYVKVPNNGTGNDWQNQLFTEVGLSFFFPTGNRAQR